MFILEKTTGSHTKECEFPDNVFCSHASDYHLRRVEE